jgi:hypothetical protein
MTSAQQSPRGLGRGEPDIRRRLLPILPFECAWKLIWLSVVAVPQLAAGTMDAATRTVFVNCLVVVIVFAVVPWRHVWQQFVTVKGDRWR